MVRGGRDLREDVARVCVPHGLLELNGRQRLEDIYLSYTVGGPAALENHA